MKNTASIIALEFAVSATKAKKKNEIKERPKKFQPVFDGGHCFFVLNLDFLWAFFCTREFRFKDEFSSYSF